MTYMRTVLLGRVGIIGLSDYLNFKASPFDDVSGRLNI